jgi:hypothetical protein
MYSHGTVQVAAFWDISPCGCTELDCCSEVCTFSITRGSGLSSIVHFSQLVSDLSTLLKLSVVRRQNDIFTWVDGLVYTWTLTQSDIDSEPRN